MVDFFLSQPTSFQFTVDTAAVRVAIVAGAGTGKMIRGDNKFVFQAGDIPRIISLAVVMPLSFQPANYANNQINIGGNFRTPAGVGMADWVPSIINIPFANYEISCDLLQVAPVVQYVMHVSQINMTGGVSMVGVPAALHGLVFQVQVFAKIEHTLDLL
jgi:hypothetical protein